MLQEGFSAKLVEMKRHRVCNCDNIVDCCPSGESPKKGQKTATSMGRYNTPDKSERYGQNKCTFRSHQDASKTLSSGHLESNRLETIYEDDILSCENLDFEEFLELESRVSVANDADGAATIDASVTDSSGGRDADIGNLSTSQLKDQMALNDQKIRLNIQKIRMLELQNAKQMLDLEQQRLSFHNKLVELENNMTKMLELEEKRLSFHKQLAGLENMSQIYELEQQRLAFHKQLLNRRHDLS